MARKRSVVLIIIGMIFGCLLATGIFAAVSKAVSFNLALKLDPQIYFSLSMKIDKTDSGTYSEEYKIFDNSEDATGIVNWATVNQNCIVLNQVMAGNILSGLTTSSRFEIIVTNLTDTTGYLNLTLNYNGAEEVFKVDNGYGAVNMAHGVASGETRATKSFKLIPQTALLDGYIQIPFKAEIDTELRYTATITTTNCVVVDAPRTFVLNETYTAEFKAPKVYCPSYTYTVTVNGSPYETTTNTSTLQIPAPLVTGNITIHCSAGAADYTVTLENVGATNAGTSSITFTSGTNSYYDSSENPITKITVPTKTHYDFAGYYSGSNGTGVQYVSADGTITTNLSALTGNATLYANWTGKTYNIIYKDKGNAEFSGLHASGYPEEYKYDAVTALKTASKTCYDFGGWFTTADCNGNAITELAANMYGGDLTLYAKWTAQTYTITYKDGGNTNFSGTHASGHPTSHTYGTATTLTTASKEGYNFLGWFTSSDCSGSAVTSLGATAYTSAITLYAKWEEIPGITITLNNQSATSAGTTTVYVQSGVNTYYTDEACTTPFTNNKITLPARTYYAFGGYYSSTGGRGTQYITADGTISGLSALSAATTIYAKWTVNLASYFAGGSGTSSSPYQISTLAQLENLATITNAGGPTSGIYFKQTANISINSGTLCNADGTLKEGNWTTWTPIGTSSNKFQGTYDGNSKTVSGIYINNESDYQGLFGYIDGSGTKIQNIGVVNSYIQGGARVGGVCGYNYYGTITNCYNTGDVASSSQYVGGVCGYNYGPIENCYNTGDVSASTASVGGVCGCNYSSGTITNCYNTGTVSGDSGVGGVCGRNLGTITNCYNTGTVSAGLCVGGVCGYNYGTITNCYNTDTVSGSSNNVGGVCGFNNSGTITNCYNTGNVTGGTQRVGGVCGDNPGGTITNCYNTGNVTGPQRVGGVCGYNSGTITNCYYLSGTASYGIGNSQSDDNAESKTATDMQSYSFATTLGSAWMWTSGKNNNYPYLSDNQPA